MSLSLVLGYRDFRIKYEHPVLGLAWTLAQPLCAVLLYSFFFGYVFSLPSSSSYPYPLFVFSGILCWMLFSYLLQQSGSSLLQAQPFARKISLPKMLFPLSKTWVALFDFLVSLVILLSWATLEGYGPCFRWLWLPVPVLMILMWALGLGCVWAAWTVWFRDAQHLLGFVAQFGLWVTPVFYVPSWLPQNLGAWLYLNPLTDALVLFRWILFDTSTVTDKEQVFLGIGTGINALMIGVSLWYFKKKSNNMQDAH